MYKLKIKKYRKLRELTQKQLARKLGLSQNYYCEIETGKYDIRLSMLFKIAKKLNVCPKKLILCRMCKKASKPLCFVKN